MSTEIQTSKSFQDKMYEKVRDNIGDLLSDEDLKKIINAAIEKAFFDKVIIPSDSSWGSDREKQSLFVANIRELLKEDVHKIMHEWIEEHKKEVQEIAKEECGRMLLDCIKQYMTGQLQDSFYTLANQLRNKGLI